MSTLHRRVLSQATRQGSAGRGILIVLCVILGIAGFLLLAPKSDEPGRGTAPVTHTQAGDPSSEIPLSSEGLAQRTSESGTNQTGYPAASDRRFEGRGRLRGSVQLSIGDQFPETWTLVLEPSKSLAGADQAVAQRVDFPGTQQDFDLLDLPLAGYDVRAEAPGFNGLSIPVLLERTSPGAYLMLQLAPAGFLSGQVRTQALEPMDGLEIWLFDGPPRALGFAPSGGRKTLSLADGTYSFSQVLDGPHTLIFGAPIAPMIEPLSISFQAPSLTVPSPKFPKLAHLRLMVVDENQLPVVGALVRGSGSKGGSFELTTLGDGMVDLTHLVPGHYRFVIKHELFADGNLERNYKGGESESEVQVLFRKP